MLNRAAALEDHAAEAEFARGFQASLFHPNTPGTTAQHARVRRIMRKVLRAWPVPLRGYDYSVSVDRTDMPNAFAYGDGRLGFTSGMLDGVGMTDAEIEMLMAHEVAHTELRHSSRMRKVVLRGQPVGSLYVRLGGRLLEFRERTAENTDPGTSAPVVFRGRLPEGVELADLADAPSGPQIPGVERWEPHDLNLYRRDIGSAWAKPVQAPASREGTLH